MIDDSSDFVNCELVVPVDCEDLFSDVDPDAVYVYIDRTVVVELNEDTDGCDSVCDGALLSCSVSYRSRRVCRTPRSIPSDWRVWAYSPESRLRRRS